MKFEDQLKATAKAMMTRGKGLLAADESSGTIAKRFEAVGIENSEENRREYRQMLITTEGTEKFLSGIILFDETIRQGDDTGKPFVEILKQKSIIPGIKVDMGAKDLALHPGEMVTEGLDGLRERFAEYAGLGAGFAKWRAVIAIDGMKVPSRAAITANAHALARYAALAQEAGIVPVIEPEVLLDGSHTIQRSAEAASMILDALFLQLEGQGVLLEGAILKASMVISGKDADSRADTEAVAMQTIKVLKDHVPANLAGVVFLSGGQDEEEATAHLDAMNKIGNLPWPLSFSYSRAIQNPVLKLCAADDIDKAKAAYLHRCEANSLASRGEWTEIFEKSRPY